MLNHIKTMAHSPLRNYRIPGLTSSLVRNVRLFECERSHEEAIVPHSHRFDFQCLVLRGVVRNVLWLPNAQGDLFSLSTLEYGNKPGEYTQTRGTAQGYFSRSETRYVEGDTYGMRHTQIHSIFFERDTAVLFFEGPELTNETCILEPVSNGKAVPTFETRPWMFQKD